MQHMKTETSGEDAALHPAGNEPFAVRQGGKVVADYHPLSSLSDADLDAPNEIDADTLAAFARLREAVQRIFDESGMTEDELADALLIGDHDRQYHAPRR